MNQTARCDWLPERASWSYLTRSRLPAVSREKIFLRPNNKSFIDQAFFGKDGWILTSQKKKQNSANIYYLLTEGEVITG